MKVRQLQARDVVPVVARIAQQLVADAHERRLVNPQISTEILGTSLNASMQSTWIAEENGRIVGHLFGALLENDNFPKGVWIGPDGVSFDSIEVLSALYRAAGTAWIDRGALEHFVWTLDGSSSMRAWFEMGFSRMHLRGVMALKKVPAVAWPHGYSIRRGGGGDLELAVSLDKALDEAQRLGPSFLIGPLGALVRNELNETLLDPEVHYYVAEFEGQGVAQCMTFRLPPQRGSFSDTLHLSAVSVLPEHQGRGIATAMVSHAFANAIDAHFRFAETNWRVTNRRAQAFWLGYGFQPTYVRLHRTIGHT